MHQAAAHNRLNQLATDLGRLRRTLDTAAMQAQRVADQVALLALLLEPSAAEIAATNAPGDDDAIAEAIRLVDQRHQQLQKQLGA